RAARRDRSSVAVDSRLGGAGDIRMAAETDIVVGGKINVDAGADYRLGAGDPLVHPKERIGYAEKFRGFADHPYLSKPFQLRYVEAGGADVILPRVGAVRDARRSHRRGGRKLLDQARL